MYKRFKCAQSIGHGSVCGTVGGAVAFRHRGSAVRIQSLTMIIYCQLGISKRRKRRNEVRRRLAHCYEITHSDWLKQSCDF